MDFGLEEHQDQLLRTVEQWIERSWARGEISSPGGRRALWGEVVANGWAGMLESGFATATVLDAALLVEHLAMGGCSLAIVGSGLIAPLAAEAAGVDVGDGTTGILAFETGGDRQPTARGLEISRFTRKRENAHDGFDTSIFHCFQNKKVFPRHS